MAFYKRSIFIINPKFQYRFSLVIASVVFVGSLMYPFTIIELYDKIISMQPENAPAIMQDKTTLLGILGLMQFALLGVIFIAAIFMSHKIAGPMYKMQMYLQGLREGNEYKPLYFRKGDNFPEIAEEVTQTLEYVINQREDDFQYLEEVSAYISNLALVIPEDKKPVVNEILGKLSEMRSRHKSD